MPSKKRSSKSTLPLPNKKSKGGKVEVATGKGDEVGVGKVEVATGKGDEPVTKPVAKPVAKPVVKPVAKAKEEEVKKVVEVEEVDAVHELSEIIHALSDHVHALTQRLATLEGVICVLVCTCVYLCVLVCTCVYLCVLVCTCV